MLLKTAPLRPPNIPMETKHSRCNRVQLSVFRWGKEGEGRGKGGGRKGKGGGREGEGREREGEGGERRGKGGGKEGEGRKRGNGKIHNE